VRLPAKSRPDQRTALDLELAFGKGSRGMAVVVRHQPSGEVIGKVTPFGLGMDGGVGRFALTVPKDLEARLGRDNQPLRLELEARDAASGSATRLSCGPSHPSSFPQHNSEAGLSLPSGADVRFWPLADARGVHQQVWFQAKT
jgi:hypothetical protein